MADTYSGKTITSLTANDEGADADLLVVGNAGTAVMRKFTLANLAAYVRDKLSSLTYSLNTTSQTLPGAINELSVQYSASYTDLSYGFETLGVTRRGNLVELKIGGSISSALTRGTWYTITTLPSQFRPSVNAPYDVSVPQTNPSAPFLISVTTSGAVRVNPSSTDLTGYINSTYWYFIN